MSANTSIEWTDASWNPLRGTKGRHHCEKISPGCKNCYAETMNRRFSGIGYEAGADTPRLDDQALLEPLKWKKPRRVFVCSMTDLFLHSHRDEWIDRIFAVMALCPQHTFQILTKRAERMRAYCGSDETLGRFIRLCAEIIDGIEGIKQRIQYKRDGLSGFHLPNVWLGVSCENVDQLTRIDALKDTPAAVHFVSFEPLLQDLGALILDGIEWGIVGGESGGNARWCDVAWVRSIVRQFKRQGKPIFVKQLGAHVIDRNDAGFEGDPGDSWTPMTRYEELTLAGWQGDPVRIRLRDRKGGDITEWPTDLQVREYPLVEVPA